MAHVPHEKPIGDLLLEALKPIADQAIRSGIKAGARALGAIAEDGARILKKNGRRLAQKAARLEEVASRAEVKEDDDVEVQPEDEE